MKLLGLTGLRGLAAILVVFYHLNRQRNIEGLSKFSWDFYQFSEHLVFVVSLFFVFSGFFRSLSYWKVWNTSDQPPRLFPSLRERFFRIVPVYYIALVISCFYVGYIDNFTFSSFIRLVSGFAFLSWISPQTFFPVDANGPLWFVAYDMIGWIGVSLIMGFVFHIRKISKIIITFLITGIFLIILHFFWISLPWQNIPGIAGEWFPIYNPFLFGTHFLVGSILGGITEWMKRKNIGSRIIFDILGILSFIFLGMFLWLIRESWDWDYSWPHGPYHFPYTMIGIAGIILSLPHSRLIGKLLDNAILSFVARISFSLYVSHALIIVILKRFFFSETHLGFMNWSIFSGVVIIISLIISWILYRYVEQYEWIKK